MRIKAEAERRAPGRWQQWLTDRLSDVSPQPYTIQRLQNWKARGVPRAEYPSLALALGRSVDWVAGMEAPPPRTGANASDDDIIAALRDMPAAEREAFRSQILARAEVFRAYLREVRGEAPEPTTAGGLPVSFVERRHSPAPPPHVERRRGVTVYTHPQADDPDAFPPRRPKSAPKPPSKPSKPSAR